LAPSEVCFYGISTKFPIFWAHIAHI
jgi:hypothetical protein